MEKTVTLNGKEYYINTTPEGLRYADVYGVMHREASGVIADAMTELTGKRPTVRDKTILHGSEVYEVVLALGRKFSRSKAWNRLYDLAQGDLYLKSRKERN